MPKHVKVSKSKNCQLRRLERRVKQRLEDEKRVEEERLEEIRRLERERKKAEARREREQQVGERRVSEVIDRLNHRNSYLADQIEEKEKRLKELELKSKIWLAANNWRMDPLEVDSINKYKGDPDETLLP
ncbi:hypothetical protein BpHYR1_001127 [Brachionus plicatilis]|uniref:Uncharacterized protein n=1 Tax=Brachionus plicatilis TaxID=10195 RepID=A0A3M7RPP4_BRAPC|nr:hypothetical protein BpHYR1_001127 [Brachionus plicatilis]